MQHTTAISPFILSKFSGKHSSKSCNPLRMLQNTLFSFPINMRKIIHMPLPHFLRHFFCYDPFPDMLPRRERRKPSLMYFIPIADFNPRSREGSDQWLPILFVHSKISIHAPARGATEVFRITPSMKLFQSTLPRGERRSRRQRLFEIARISIHAPARGATVVSILTCPSNSYFNPRSREGSDVCFRVYERLSIYFNPRSREGSDNVYYEYSKYRGISIHAPARGATIASSPLSSGLIRFQSTLPRGERRYSGM